MGNQLFKLTIYMQLFETDFLILDSSGLIQVFSVYFQILRFVFSQHISSLEFLKGLLVSSSPGDFQCVKFDGLRERSAFTDSNNISDLNVPEKDKKG